MAKFSQGEREKLVEQARSLYIKGFDLKTISQYISQEKEVSVNTLKKWVVEFDFEKSRKVNGARRKQLLNTIFESIDDAVEGKKPKMKALEAAQYAAAIEKLSDKKKLIIYSMEAFEELTSEILLAAEKEKNPKKSEQLFDLIQVIRPYMDRTVNRIEQEAA